MKVFLSICTFFIALRRKVFLFIIRRDPSIIYFECDPLITVNDHPQFIRWRTKYCWKVEIEEIGRVNKKDCQILNNKKLHPTLTLIAYGRKKKVARQVLSLNLKKVSLPVTSLLNQTHDAAHLITGTTGTEALLDEIDIYSSAFTKSFLSCQENEEVQELLKIVDPPARISLNTDSLTSIMNNSAKKQDAYFARHYQKELNEHLQNQNLKLWTKEPH